MVLRVIEQKIEALFEGVFGRAFRTNVQPVETMIYKARAQQQATEGVSPAELGLEPELVTLTFNGAGHEVKGRRAVIGRGRDCDIQLSDSNVSRRHAELRQEGASYWIVDLGSTNGIEVNGKRVKRAKLRDGDTFTLGSTDVTFSLEQQ